MSRHFKSSQAGAGDMFSLSQTFSKPPESNGARDSDAGIGNITTVTGPKGASLQHRSPQRDIFGDGRLTRRVAEPVSTTYSYVPSPAARSSGRELLVAVAASMLARASRSSGARSQAS